LNSRRGPSEVGTREKLFIGESGQRQSEIRVGPQQDIRFSSCFGRPI
jgi:hypothetical protein